MQLSRAGEYAIRAMLHLAAMEGRGVAQISVISRTWDIPESFLRKILQLLTRAGLVTSSRGSGGGFALARSAAEITLLNVIEAVEGKLFLNKCLIGPGFCDNTSWCPVHVVWEKAQRALKEILGGASLADLVAKPEFNKHVKIN